MNGRETLERLAVVLKRLLNYAGPIALGGVLLISLGVLVCAGSSSPAAADGTENGTGLAYTVTLDAPPGEVDTMQVSLTISETSESQVYFIFCWYQNQNYKANITETQSEQLGTISASSTDGSDLAISLVHVSVNALRVSVLACRLCTTIG